MKLAALETPLEELPAQDDRLAWLFGDAEATAAAIARQARETGRDWVFGWLRLANGATAAEVGAAISALGFQPLGAAGPLLRVRLPAAAANLAAATALDIVTGVGVVPPERKVPSAFLEQLQAQPGQRIPVLITLMAGDPDGRWRRALQAFGAEVGGFDPDIRAYAANVDVAAAQAMTNADFVLAVEPMRRFQAAHDTAAPALGVDALRFHDTGPGLFRGVGGGAVPIGVMDTGLNTNHPDIAKLRQSICGVNFVREPARIEDADLWVDAGGHGTHVTGTIVGNGFANPNYAGMAPAVGHIRVAKVLNRAASGWSDQIYRGMNYLARASGCGARGAREQPVKPLIVNMSLSANNLSYQGRTTSERKLDATVWAHRQLYVVAQSNANFHGFSNYGAAKNSLSVGATHDSGELAGFSSWGPTYDGRLAPQVVAPGVDIRSPRGQGAPGGYVSLQGTSMASPATAGVAALLMDAVADFRERPALARARLMASAVKPNAWLDSEDAFATTNTNGPGRLQTQYGLGKVSARTTVLQRRTVDGWENGAAASTLTNGSYAYRDIIVPEGASRLDLVLTWDEPPADTLGSTVLNDLDLWLDKDADCDTPACGEIFSASRRDNVEWIILKNPPAGTYRARVVPRRVYTAAPRAALAWTVVRGAATPSLALAVDEVRRVAERHYRVVLALSANAYVAAAARIAIGPCRLANGSACQPETTIRPIEAEDGAAFTPADNAVSALVGEVAVGETQKVAIDVRLREEETDARLHFTASAWNGEPATAAVTFPSASVRPAATEAVPPANDHFADAATLEGAMGSREIDLSVATFQAGEPQPSPFSGTRPWASVWYRWRAPAHGAVRFNVSAPAEVDVLRGERLGSLRQLVSNRWSASFFAEADEIYHVRVSDHGNASRKPGKLTLSWAQGPRPANDDFADAVALEGSEGEMAGTNVAATIQPGEWLGNFTASVWYRWTAPGNGVYWFETDSAASFALAFTGDDIQDLRLVSRLPESGIWIAARGGTEYAIAVAAGGAYVSGRGFVLKWRAATASDRRVSNDDFANAARLAGSSGSASFRLWGAESVESNEPAQTGVRTRWWRWTAPADGRFTWRLGTGGATEVKLAAFQSDADDPALADLTFVAGTGDRVSATEFTFSAVDGQRYWISAGFHSGDYAAFHSDSTASLQWGETPSNDSLAHAAVLAGESGTATASNHYATLEIDEPSGALGHSSLWWSFTPAEAGWYRFWVDDHVAQSLAVYAADGEGFDGLRLLARSHGRWRAADETAVAEALFEASAEQRYLVRLGQLGQWDGAEATLNWERTQAPTWLRYRGRLRAAALGLPDAVDERPAFAFDSDGKALYVAIAGRLHVLARNADSGTLAPSQVVPLANPRSLLWDHVRSKLYVFDDCAWRQFGTRDDSRLRLVAEGELQIADDTAFPCGVRAAFLDSTGGFLHHGHDDGMEVHALSESTLTAVQRLELSDVHSALMASDEAHVYVVARDGYSVEILRRDAQSGMLSRARAAHLLHNPAVAFAGVGDDYLFALSAAGNTDAYAIADSGARLRHVGNAAAIGDPPWRRHECGLAAARTGPAALDAFCANSAFSVVVRGGDDGDEPSVVSADYLANWQPDRFNNHIPEFSAQGLATSPDGKHAYVHSDGDMLIFERVGNPPPD